MYQNDHYRVDSAKSVSNGDLAAGLEVCKVGSIANIARSRF